MTYLPAVTQPPSFRRPPFTKALGLLLTVILVSGVSGALGGYFFGQRVVVQEDGKEMPFQQTVQVEESSATIDAVNSVGPAVVSILSKTTVNGFYGPNVEEGAGSGFILTEDGLIATNKHVVRDDNSEYTVALADGRTFVAEIVSRDPSFDFAIIKIEASNLPIVELGSSDNLQVGENVIAIGNAFGEFQNTVTSGVLSAKNRTIEASDAAFRVELLEGLLQTDAAINPGNSGGPLINLSGQVVGVNTATDPGSQNIGFAIPIDDARVAIDSVIENGQIIRPLLGVRYVNLNKEISELNGLTTGQGAYVVAGGSTPAVVPGSPAEEVGLQTGDIILSINEHEISPDQSLAAVLRKFRPEDTVTIKWQSGDQDKQAEVQLGMISES